MWESFQECGWAAWLSLLLGFIGMGLALVALVLAIARPRAGMIVGVLAVAIALTPMGAGVAGTFVGRAKVDSVLPVVSPDERPLLRKAGYAEAGQCTTVGLACGAFPFLMSAAALGSALLRSKRDDPSVT